MANKSNLAYPRKQKIKSNRDRDRRFANDDPVETQVVIPKKSKPWAKKK